MGTPVDLHETKIGQGNSGGGLERERGLKRLRYGKIEEKARTLPGPPSLS